MAKLILEDGTTLENLKDIRSHLEPLGVKLSKWDIDRSASWSSLLKKDQLSNEEKEEVLKGCEKYFNKLQEEHGYQERDLIVLHPKLDGLSNLTSKFDKVHTHDDDEVRYIVDGEGVFGFVLPNGKQVALEIHPEEYINVPKDTEHWFYLTSKKRIKAVRYFTSSEGWAPVYTDTERRI